MGSLEVRKVAEAADKRSAPGKDASGVVDLIDRGAKTLRAGCDYPVRGLWLADPPGAGPAFERRTSMALGGSDKDRPTPACTAMSSARREERRELLWGIFAGVPIALAVLIGFAATFRTFSIPSASMEPGIPAGSYVLVSRAAYGFGRESFDAFALPIEGRWPANPVIRGDVVVFRLPKDRNIVWLKRVVGVGGDRVQMVQDHLVLNGEVLQREAYDPTHVGIHFIEHMPGGGSYRINNGPGLTGPVKNTAEVTVPAGRLFVLGDNRDNSTDSRMPAEVGFIPIEKVVGKVIMRFDSWPRLLGLLQRRPNGF